MVVNGEEINGFENKSIIDILNYMNIDEETVVVELDRNILNRDEYSTKKLSPKSKVEIIRFVGGG